MQPNGLSSLPVDRDISHQVDVVARGPGAAKGAVADPTKRKAITGPCQVGWKDALTREYRAQVG
jgi:hypothetical protein